VEAAQPDTDGSEQSRPHVGAGAAAVRYISATAVVHQCRQRSQKLMAAIIQGYMWVLALQ